MPLLTIHEAAERLGVSEGTVRRHPRKGELVGAQEATPQCYVWRVNLPGDGETVTSQEVGQEAAAATQHATDHVLVEELRGQVDYLKQEQTERKREHDRDRDDLREERQQLNVLLAREQDTAQSLTHRLEQLPATATSPTIEARARAETLHTYVSQAVQPLLLLGIPILIAAGSVVWQFTRGVDWESLNDVVVLGLSILGLILSMTLVVIFGREARAALAREGAQVFPNATSEELAGLDRSIRVMVWAMVFSVVTTILFLIPPLSP